MLNTKETRLVKEDKETKLYHAEEFGSVIFTRKETVAACSAIAFN